MAEFGNHARIPLSFLKEKKRDVFLLLVFTFKGPNFPGM